MLNKALLSIVLLLFTATTALAQLGTEGQIEYDQVVEDTITDDEFFDWWHLNAAAGDVIVVTMVASDGLAPLIGLLSPGRSLVARSDQVSEDQLMPAPPNGRTQLEYVAQESGDYIINATRDGNADGTTTGSYSLTVRRANAEGPSNSLQPVEFRCGEILVTTVATLQFTQDAQQDLRVRVYSLDAFEPVIRIASNDTSGSDEDCINETEGLLGDQLMLPEIDPITIGEEDIARTAGIGLDAGTLVQSITMNIGSADGVAGQWVVVIEGFSIAPEGDVDVMDARIGPLAAATTDMLVYMVAVGTSRLNPQVGILPPEDDSAYVLLCNDIGRRGCQEDLPELDGLGVILADGTEILGDRFTAGIRLSPGDVSVQELEFSSFAPNATGNYALIFMGELPPRESADDDGD